MFNHELYASTLARAVDLMRQTDAKDQQKAALRALVALAASGSATVRCYDGVLSVDDVGIDASVPHTGVLAGRLAAHGIAEIAIGRGAEPAELLALMRGLAEGPYGMHIKERLREAKSQRIWVLLSDVDDVPSKRNSLSTLFEAPGETKPGAAKADDPLAEWEALHASGSASSTIKEIDLGIPIEPDPPPADVVAPPPAEEAPAPRTSRQSRASGMQHVEVPIDPNTTLGKALMALALRPHAGNVLDRLTALADEAQATMRKAPGDVLRALAMAVRFEEQAEEGTPKNSYRIVLKRFLGRDALEKLAPLAADPNLTADAALVFAKSGSEGAEVLLSLLSESESSRERRAYMTALRGVQAGHGRIVQMLQDDKWFVARNAAELCGELRIEEGVPDLTILMRNQDQRLRRAAAVALAKIATSDACESLRIGLQARDSETRALAASLLGSAHAAALALPLIARLDAEDDGAVLKEICLALARMATPEATQALERAASQGGGLFSRRAKAARQAAEEALKKLKRS